jgi:hypothetical protein
VKRQGPGFSPPWWRNDGGLQAVANLVKFQQSTAEAAWSDVIAHQERLGQTMRTLGGLEYFCHLSDQDRDNSLLIARFGDRADFDRVLESAEYTTVIDAAPRGLSPAFTECYEIVSEVLPT